MSVTMEDLKIDCQVNERSSKASYREEIPLSVSGHFRSMLRRG